MIPEWKRRGYELSTEIGSGSFGKVYCAQKKGDPKKYAVKIIDNVNSYFIEDIEGQVRAMKKIKGPYTLSLVENFYDENQLQYVLITEYIGGGDLSNLIWKRKGEWSLQEIVALAAQIALAFIEMNQNQIIHRDLKPENILVDDKGFYKVCDFGCAKFIDISASKFLLVSKPVGTQLYNSPEVYNGENYNSTTDVWSLGAILYKMVYNKYHLKVDNEEIPNTDFFIQISKMERTIDFPNKPGVNPELLWLVKSMLEVQKEKRITWPKIIEYIYVTFPFIIYKGEQLFNHQSLLTKILRDILELLAEERTTNELLQVGLDKKVKSKVTNLLVLLQYDEMCDAELALQKCGYYRGAFILPHLANEIRDPQVDEKFQSKKTSGYDLRKVVPGKIAIEKLRQAIGKESAELSSRLEDAMKVANGTTQQYPNLRKIAKALSQLGNYSSLFEVANNDKLTKAYEQMFVA